MNPDLQTSIAAIKAECEEILRLSEKATAGLWKSHLNWVTRGPQSVAKTLLKSKEDDASFIAHARNVSPSMARVVVATIKNIEFALRIGKLSDAALEAATELVKQWEGKQ